MLGVVWCDLYWLRFIDCLFAEDGQVVKLHDSSRRERGKTE